MASERLKNLRGAMDALFTLEQAYHALNSPDPEESAQAREAFSKVVEENSSYRLQPADFQDSQKITLIRDELLKLQAEQRIAPYMEHEGEETVRDLEEGDLVKKFLATEPSKVDGDETHNKAAKVHERMRKYLELAQKTKNGENYGSIIKDVVKAIEEEVERRLTSKDNPMNKWIDKKVIERMKKLFSSIIGGSPEAASQVLVYAANSAGEEFEKIYKTDTEKADYARRNLYAQIKDKKKRIGAARAINAIASSEDSGLARVIRMPAGNDNYRAAA